MEKRGYVYILFNTPKTGALYVGVTSNLVKRIFEHKEKLVDGFTRTYGIDKLGYYEDCGNIESAIMREKQIKGGSRSNKIKLIQSVNPKWLDLYKDII